MRFTACCAVIDEATAQGRCHHINDSLPLHGLLGIATLFGCETAAAVTATAAVVTAAATAEDETLILCLISTLKTKSYHEDCNQNFPSGLILHYSILSKKLKNTYSHKINS